MPSRSRDEERGVGPAGSASSAPARLTLPQKVATQAGTRSLGFLAVPNRWRLTVIESAGETRAGEALRRALGPAHLPHSHAIEHKHRYRTQSGRAAGPRSKSSLTRSKRRWLLPGSGRLSPHRVDNRGVHRRTGGAESGARAWVSATLRRFGRSDRRAELLALARTITRADAAGIAEGDAKRGPMAEPWALFARVISLIPAAWPAAARHAGPPGAAARSAPVGPEGFHDLGRVVLLPPQRSTSRSASGRRASASRRAW